ncbi:flagellar biosynthesis protein [Dyella dinghuensis]|uniref:Flagellar biosynthesis protein n=1 Tax=Dyella dinghuensis TaxID=1920169 RepID=A0A432LRS2_9GAMM|nr:flagellar biosynthesis protein [Dyella dinghuensis]RUL62954.1 flagellar biosynthesis protein [Dyella dinghuensis]
MSQPLLPSPQRKVVLRLSGGGDTSSAQLNTVNIDNLLKHAHALGLPLHSDPQIAAVLASLRMNANVPPLLYAAAAAMLAGIYDASKKA